MAILNRFSGACWKSVPTGLLNEQLFLVSRALQKSAASEALEIPAAGGEAMSDRLIGPAVVRENRKIKTLKEMPGPSTLSNLIEFFWKDGFSRIHEIQVNRSRNCLFLSGLHKKIIYLSFHSWQGASVLSASASYATYAQNGTDCCVKAHPELDPLLVFRSKA